MTDVEEAYEAFARDEHIAVGQRLSRTPAENSEVAEFFARFEAQWTADVAKHWLEVRGANDDPIAVALRGRLPIRRDVFVANTVALRSSFGESKVVVDVNPAPSVAQSGTITLPIISSPRGVFVGPFQINGVPCQQCIDAMSAGLFFDADCVAPTVASAGILAHRILDALLTKQPIPFYDSYLVFRDGLDTCPVENQAVRRAGCRNCDAQRQPFPKRWLRDTHDKAITVLRERGLLADEAAR